MIDLNELAYFVKAVDHQGFAPAARALGLQKSKLSRRVAQLEERLGVRLIQRSTRKFAVTEIGLSYYQHCVAMLFEAEAAQQVIDVVQAEPAGLIRVACPPGLLTYRMGSAIAEYMAAHPKVEVQLKAFNRPVDLIREGFDVVIRSGTPKIETSLVIRKLGEVSQCMVAAPALLNEAVPRLPLELASFPAMAAGSNFAQENYEWHLSKKDGSTALVPFMPRLVSDDLSALRSAALAGIGVVQMPNLMITDDLREGRLLQLLPDWNSPNISVHAIFPSRRGLLPSVRALIDHLAGDCVQFRDGTAHIPQVNPDERQGARSLGSGRLLT